MRFKRGIQGLCDNGPATEPLRVLRHSAVAKDKWRTLGRINESIGSRRISCPVKRRVFLQEIFRWNLPERAGHCV